MNFIKLNRYVKDYRGLTEKTETEYIETSHIISIGTDQKHTHIICTNYNVHVAESIDEVFALIEAQEGRKRK